MKHHQPQPPRCLSPVHWPQRVLKSVAWLVIVVFSANCLSPAIVSAKTLIEHPAAQRAPAPTAMDKTSAALIALEDTLDRMNRRLNGQFEFAWQATLAQKSHALPPTAATRADLQTLQTQLDTNVLSYQAEQPAVSTYFTQATHALSTRHVSNVIQQRAKAQADTIAKLSAQLNGLLAAIDAAKTDADYKTAVAAATAFMHNYSSKPKRAAFDPKHLAFDPTGVKSREALTDATALRKALKLPLSTHDTSATAPAADLAPTEDVQITAAIKAKAAALDNNALKIYQYVRNHVEYLPTYGSIEGSDYTLQTLRGNDMDQASLLIALLRAANIPARYVYGTIRVPIEQVENWVGNVSDPMAAMNLMGQGGIPVLGLAQGGVIKFAQIEHVWVEAQLGYGPSRGAITTPGNTWVPMDPSFKQYTYTAPINVSQIANMSLDSDLSTAMAHAASTTSTITGIDGAFVKQRLAIYQQNLQAYAESQATPLTLEQSFGSRTIVDEVLPVLAGALPYNIVTVASRMDVLPDSLRHTIKIELYRSANDQALQSPYLTKTVPLPALGLRRLGITYVPATPSDAEVLQNLTGTTIPLYKVKVKPEIRLDKTVIAQGDAVGMGQDQPIDLVLTGPTGQHRLSYLRIAGDEMVIGVDSAGLTLDDTLHRRQQVPENSAAENLHQLALSYWAECDLLNRLTESGSIASMRLPSAGIFSSPLSVTYSFGVPNFGSYIKRNIDIKESRIAVVGRDQRKIRDYVGTTGIMSSYLEGSIQEQLFHYWQGTALSAAQSLADANRQAIPILVVTAENSASLMPRLDLPQIALADVADGVAAGYEAIVPQTTPARPVGAQGVGYEIRNPVTGEASYRILNGTDGGDSLAPCA
ncbi:MAG: transglutaminase-like domain-containing protein, partial [Xanthomonadales bacterium]|nr:transglutaminase-like domain-containing protein [Xanthomonadales bacterium]